MCRPSLTTCYRAKLKPCADRESRLLRRRARQGHAATALTTSARASPSCSTRAWTCPSPATPPTPPASSTPLPAPTRRSASKHGKKYFSVASGGGTGRTLHPDNMAAGPASYGMTDTMGRMHSDAQFAGSSSVPAHVEMMGSHRHGQQPHGRRDRRGGCRCRRSAEERVIWLLPRTFRFGGGFFSLWKKAFSAGM